MDTVTDKLGKTAISLETQEQRTNGRAQNGRVFTAVMILPAQAGWKHTQTRDYSQFGRRTGHGWEDRGKAGEVVTQEAPAPTVVVHPTVHERE